MRVFSLLQVMCFYSKYYETNVSIVVTLAKVLASIFLVAFFIAGIFKANPRTHNPERRPMAEYMAGFLISVFSLAGLYYLWVS